MSPEWNIDSRKLSEPTESSPIREPLWDKIYESPSGQYAAIAHSVWEFRMACHSGSLVVVETPSNPTIAADFSSFEVLVSDSSIAWLKDSLLVARLYNRQEKTSSHDISLTLFRVEDNCYAIIPDSNNIESTVRILNSEIEIELSPSAKKPTRRYLISDLDWKPMANKAG